MFAHVFLEFRDLANEKCALDIKECYDQLILRVPLFLTRPRQALLLFVTLLLQHTLLILLNLFFCRIVLCSEKLNGESISPRERTWRRETTQRMNTAYALSLSQPENMATSMMKRSCFWTWDDNQYIWQSGPFKGRQGGNKIRRRKRQGRLKRIGNAYLGEEQTQDIEWWSAEASVWWLKGRRGKKRPFERKEQNFPISIHALFLKEKVPTRSSSQTKERVKIGVNHILNRCLLPWNRQVKKDMAIPRNQTIGTGHTACMASVPLDLANDPTHVVLDLGCNRSIGSRAAIKKIPETCVAFWHHKTVLPLQHVLCANSEMETCWESCIISFPTKPPCSTRVDVLETSSCAYPFLTSANGKLGNDH